MTFTDEITPTIQLIFEKLLWPIFGKKLKVSTKYLIRKRALGDVLWIEPVIKELSKKYRKVIVYTKFTSLFENYPAKNVVFKDTLNLLDKLLIGLDTFFSASFFSINLDMSYERDPHKHILLAYLKKAGLPQKRIYPELYLSENDKIIPGTRKPYVVLHISAASTSKNFRNAFGIDWELVVSHISTAGFDIVEIGEPPVKFPHYYQKTNIREMVGLVAGSAFFIGLDSGPSHIAASLKIPAIVFFGAVNPAFRHFTDQFKGIILQNYCEFAGCYHNNPTAFLDHSCRLVGDLGIPKCCHVTSNQVTVAIDELMIKYAIKND